MRTDNLTLADLEQWVNNDEGLYNWWQSTRPRISLRSFVRANREELRRVIFAVLNQAPCR